MSIIKGSKKRDWETIRTDVFANFFKEKERPVLIGPVSMHLKCSLSEAEEVLERIREEGFIRLLTKAERFERNLHHAYVLEKRPPV